VSLPEELKEIWKSAYTGDSDKAWARVKKSFVKTEKGWVKRPELVEFSMYITKSTLNNGVMTWASVNSDTDPDSYAERMSLDLYKDFIGHIKNEDPIPENLKSEVCSDFWCGGMPYLSISHYPDLNGQAVPGEPLEIYVDGKQLKAKGILSDNPLGHAVWRSLKADKNKQPEDKIRISIGFLDTAHKHGEDGEVFVRESLFSLCPECLQGVGQKIYVKGYLVHLALTRVPVNKRTEMVLEEKSMAKKITRKDDAASIVGEELAEEVEMKQKATAQRSDVLVEMSETEEETQELVDEVEDEVETPSDDAEVPSEAPPVEAVEEKLVVEKADETVAAVTQATPAYIDNLPYGGAVTMGDAEKYMEAKNEAIYVMDMWSVFSNVAWNILERSDIGNKKDAMVNAIDGFKNILTAKAMVAFSKVEEEPHPLQPHIDELLEAIDGSVNKSEAERAEVLNPMLQNLAPAITDYLSQKSDVEQPVPEDDNKDNLLQEITNLIQPIADKLGILSEEVNTMKSQATAQGVQPKERIPRPRTITGLEVSNLTAKSETANKSTTPKLRDIINKSIGQ
jgi:hypothetical protein